MTSTEHPTKRIAAGEYEMGSGARTVFISRYDWLSASDPQWVARASWDKYFYTDPVWTLREAKAVAAVMLNDTSEV